MVKDDLEELKNAIEVPQNAEVSFNIKKNKERVRSLQLKNDDLEKSNKHRNTLVRWMMCVVSLWLTFTAVIVSIQLSKNSLSDRVLCVLLSTTTINVLGLAIIVLRGLFYKNNK